MTLSETSSRLVREVRPLQSSGIQLNSYTDSGAILCDIEQQEDVTNKSFVHDVSDDSDDELDITGMESATKIKIKTESPIKQDSSHVTVDPEPGAVFVNESAAEIGVRLRPVEVDPYNVPGVSVHVVEDMMFSSMKCFLDDILREAVSVIFDENRLPEEISVADVHKAVMSLDKIDFISNQGLGTILEEDPNS